jgi:hypothetical protein
MKRRRLVVSVALSLWLTGLSAAPTTDLAPLVKATQRLARDPKAVTVVWWLPPALFEGLLEQRALAIPSEEGRQMTAALHGYALFALLHVSRDESGTLAPASRDEVLKNSRLEIKGKTLKALAPDQVSPEAQQILTGMQGGLVRSMGLNGQALYIIAYPAEQNGSPLFDPSTVPEFTFHSYGHDFVFSTRLPNTHSQSAT